MRVKNVWRVSPDGELRDTWNVLRRVFMMPEESFFEHYGIKGSSHTEYLDKINSEIAALWDLLPDLPFGNIWIAQQMADKLPKKSELHLGIYNSLRSWNFFKLPDGVQSRCNVGGFGIDGGLSTMIGASLANPQKLYLGVFGDLAFFYDMNVLGNRHIGNNVRILLINNGKGAEFRRSDHVCCFLGEEADKFIAAAGHFGNKSHRLVKHYAADLGFEYTAVRNKQEFIEEMNKYVDAKDREMPLIIEAFTNAKDESDALSLLLNCLKEDETVT